MKDQFRGINFECGRRRNIATQKWKFNCGKIEVVPPVIKPVIKLQIVGIPMDTNCVPLVADLFLFCYERDFMLSFADDNQSEVVEAFNSTSRYLGDLLNIENNFFDSMVNHIYPSKLRLNKSNVSYRGVIFGFTFIYTGWFC